MSGWKMEVEVDGVFSGNGVVWPDMDSALSAGRDLMGRWMLVTSYQAVATNEAPNRPTWDEYVSANGLPPKSVSL
jgi:hypothetical protein